MTFRAIVPLLCGGLLLLVGVTSVRVAEFGKPLMIAETSQKDSSGSTKMKGGKCKLLTGTKMCGGSCPPPKNCYSISDFPTKCGCK